LDKSESNVDLVKHESGCSEVGVKVRTVHGIHHLSVRLAQLTSIRRSAATSSHGRRRRAGNDTAGPDESGPAEERVSWRASCGALSLGNP
jgi:hypothetical protein